MTTSDIIYLRLANQQLSGSNFHIAADLVKCMGCIQAQEFNSAKWAVANRVKSISDEQIEHEFNTGKILRTHVLRPTWHFVCPEDIGWMIKLTAPHVKALMKGVLKQNQLTESTLIKGREILLESLAGNRELTRQQIAGIFDQHEISTEDIRLGLILMYAELDGVICSGAKQGNQFTYALLSEKAPGAVLPDNEAAIKELAKRYFLSRGPATVQDFSWWSGLSMVDCKKGVEMNKGELEHSLINGNAYLFSANAAINGKSKSVLLLPAFDEYTIGYKDRSAAVSKANLKETGGGIFKPLIISNGEIIGSWRRTLSKNKVLVEIMPLVKFNKSVWKMIQREGLKYGKFLKSKVKISELEKF